MTAFLCYIFDASAAYTKCELRLELLHIPLMLPQNQCFKKKASFMNICCFSGMPSCWRQISHLVTFCLYQLQLCTAPCRQSYVCQTFHWSSTKCCRQHVIASEACNLTWFSTRRLHQDQKSHKDSVLSNFDLICGNILPKIDVTNMQQKLYSEY